MAADEGSFSKAAEKLFVSPSALAQQITTLERSLDFKLFTRNYQGIWLTEAGKDFYSRAKEITALTESAVAHGRQVDAGKNIEMGLRIAFAYDNGSPAIQKIVWLYKKSYPDAVLSFAVQPIPLNIEELLSGKLDFFESPDLALAEQNGLSFFKLTEYPAYCTISENHPLAVKEKISFSDLNGYHIIMPSPDLNPALAHLREALRKQVSCSISDLEFRTGYPFSLYYGRDVRITFNPRIIKGCRCIPLDWDETCASGLTYRQTPGAAKEAFLDIAKELMGQGEFISDSKAP
jgi:DNA-binding transcriptional LysR family regulator